MARPYCNNFTNFNRNTMIIDFYGIKLDVGFSVKKGDSPSLDRLHPGSHDTYELVYMDVVDDSNRVCIFEFWDHLDYVSQEKIIDLWKEKQ